MKATINLSSGFFSKNGTPFADLNYTDETEYNQQATYFLNIGELEKTVNLDDFQKAYWRSDTEQKHPIYYMPYDETVKFDLKDQEVTPFIIDNTSTLHKLGTSISEGASFNIGRGVKTNGEYDNTEARDIYSRIYGDSLSVLYPDYYGVRRCYMYYSGKYTPYLVDTLDTCMSMIKPLQSTMETYFTGYNGSGIKCYLDDFKDKVIAPAMRTDMSTGSVGQKGRILAYDQTFTQELINFFPTTNVQSNILITWPDEHYGKGSYYKNDIFDRISIHKAEEDQWTNIYMLPGFGIQNDILYYTQIDNNYSYRTPVIILKDNSDDYWFLYLSGIRSYNSSIGESQSGMGSYSPVVVLLPIKELPKLSTASNRAVNRSDVSSYIIDELDGDEEYYKLLMKRAFNPQSGPSYDDGGPDAVGPGDPYADDNNAGDVVGGESNMVDELEENNKSPNDGMTQYLVSGGLYGAYKIDAINLQQYTNTLDMLYSKSATPVIGAIWEQYASRITKNSTSLIMLPYDIPPSNLTENVVNFIVGNAYIAGTIQATEENWDSYKVGHSIGQTRRIVQEYYTYTTDLGYLDHYYDTFLDFAPYVSASLYLPYIGTVALPLNLIQSTSGERKHLTLTWNISNLNGDIVCMLNVNNMTIMYWTGNCARAIPLSIDNNGAFVRESAQQIAGSILSALR